jgi:hypothetical protein
LTEQYIGGSTDLKTGSDSGTLTDTGTLATQDLKVGSDTFVVLDTAAVNAALAALDSMTMTEAAAYSGQFIASDSATLDDSDFVGGQQQFIDVSDSAILSEAADLLQTLQVVASDAFAMTESPPVGSDYASLILSRSPRAYFRMNETEGMLYADASGNNNTGTTSIAPTLGVPGIPGSSDNLAFEMNGVNQRFQLPLGDPIAFSDRTWTMECWALPDPVNFLTNSAFMGAGRTTGTAPTLLIGSGNPPTQMRIVVRNDAATSVDLTTTGLNLMDGNWHHFVLTVNGGQIRAYYDGGLVLSSNSTPPTPYTISRVSVGALQRNTVTGWVDGSMDEVAFYNYPLTPTQVAENYTAGLTPYVSPGYVRATVDAFDSGALQEQIDLVQAAFLDVVDSGALSEDDELAIFIGVDYTHNLPPQVIRGGYRGDGNVFAPVMAGETPPYAAIIVGAHSARIVLLSPRHEGIVLDPDDEAIVGYEADGTLR